MVYYIPDIKLVGYGRTQFYQIVCLRCGCLSFNTNKERKLEDLFCDDCSDALATESKKNLLKEDNRSSSNRIGNIVGWEQKSATAREIRSRYNYIKTYKRDKYTCQYCGYSPYTHEEFIPLHIDHLKPWVVGGGNDMDNLVVACQKCNQIASSKWFESVGEKRAYILEQVKLRKGSAK